MTTGIINQRLRPSSHTYDLNSDRRYSPSLTPSDPTDAPYYQVHQQANNPYNTLPSVATTAKLQSSYGIEGPRLGGNYLGSEVSDIGPISENALQNASKNSPPYGGHESKFSSLDRRALGNLGNTNNCSGQTARTRDAPAIAEEPANFATLADRQSLRKKAKTLYSCHSSPVTSPQRESIV